MSDQTHTEQSESLVKLADERTAAQEHAVRQVGHLEREIRYGYSDGSIRASRTMAVRAVTGYLDACEAFDRAARQQRSRRS